MTAASIWLIFLFAGFDSLATGEFCLIAFVVVGFAAALTLRLVLVAVLVAVFVFPSFEICVSRRRPSPTLVTQLTLKGNRIQPIHGRIRELFLAHVPDALIPLNLEKRGDQDAKNSKREEKPFP